MSDIIGTVKFDADFAPQNSFLDWRAYNVSFKYQLIF